MAHSSKNGSSLRPPDGGDTKEAWKSAPSRETTHDDPEGRDVAAARKRKHLENDPRNAEPTDPKDPDTRK